MDAQTDDVSETNGHDQKAIMAEKQSGIEKQDTTYKDTPVSHKDKTNKYILHGLQAAGGAGLVVSALIEGNIGRLITGGLNAGRNIWQLTTLFNTKSRKSERRNEVIMNGVSAGTNVPQMLTSASVHELGAASSAVVAYSLRATRYKFSRRMAQYRAKLPPTGHTAMNILIKSTNKILRFGPSVMLFNRAIAQTSDGLARHDWAAFGSGVAFTLGAIFMAASDRKRDKRAKQIKEEKKQKKRRRFLQRRKKASTGGSPIIVNTPNGSEANCPAPTPATLSSPPEQSPVSAQQDEQPIKTPETGTKNSSPPPQGGNRPPKSFRHII